MPVVLSDSSRITAATAVHRVHTWDADDDLIARCKSKKGFLFIYLFFRAAFKFGRRVHFALRRKMLKLPIARIPTILLDFINRPSGKTDCKYEIDVKSPSTRPYLISIHVNSKHE